MEVSLCPSSIIIELKVENCALYRVGFYFRVALPSVDMISSSLGVNFTTTNKNQKSVLERLVWWVGACRNSGTTHSCNFIPAD